MYLNYSFLDSSSMNNKKNIFINKSNGLIYLKDKDQYYRQSTEDNPFIYEADNEVNELTDLTMLHFYGPIWEGDTDEVSRQITEYVCNALSNTKKPLDNCIYALNNNKIVHENERRSYFSSNIPLTLKIYHETEIKVKLDELLYVPKKVENLQLTLESISIVTDGIELTFYRYLSDSVFRITYDKNFAILSEGCTSRSF